MLAGYVLPASEAELVERLQLETFETILKHEKKTTYFKRVVLAAEIAFKLHNEVTFGRVKFQKIMYLCEHTAHMKLQERYSKQVAGPFDNRFMHSIEKEFKKNKWFEVEKIRDGNITRSKYKPLSLVENYKPYFKSYFQEEAKAIDAVIELFRTVKTDKAEIAATLYACCLEVASNSPTVLIPDILERFYAWSEKKKRFDAATVELVWQWMIENKLVQF
jgi:hypothetical protein